MYIFQKIATYFGREYVLLKNYDNRLKLRRMYKLGNMYFADPYLPNTRCELLPGGKIGIGASYVSEWFPVTKKSFVLYE